MKNFIHQNRKTALRGICYALFLAFAFPLFATGQFAGGSGTQSDPYVISEPAQLASLATFVNAGNAAYNSAHYRLANDIDLSAYQSGVGWTPIGNFVNWFGGVFDGANRVITGLVIKNTPLPTAGLFGCAAGGAAIKNLGVVDVVINYVDPNPPPSYGGMPGSDGISLGAIVGWIRGSTVSDCYSTGSITSNSHIISCVGGIVGYSEGYATDCRSSCIIQSSATQTTYTGGIAGYTYCVISRCYFTGSVSAASPYDYSNAGVGGIAGYHHNGTVTDCYSTGAVSADATGSAYAGGIAGISIGWGQALSHPPYYISISSFIKNCWTTSEVTVGNSARNKMAGGVVGQQSNTLTDCAAFNPRLNISGVNFGRVSSGISGKNGNNVAFHQMINPAGGTDWENIGANSADGMDFNYLTLISDGTVCERFKPENGWTVENGKLPGLNGQAVDIPAFLVTSAAAEPCSSGGGYIDDPQQPLTAYEYWFDNDFSGRRQTAIAESEQFSLDQIDAKELSEGVHTLHFRARDAAGKWSVVNSQPFYSTASTVGVASPLNYYEYWFDDDFASQKKFTPTAGTTLTLKEADATACAEGVHRFHYRVRDAAGKWSVVYSQPFYRTASATGVASPLSDYEYWFDDDFASRKKYTPAAGTTLTLKEVDATACDEGVHRFHYHARDEAGRWSAVYSQPFYKTASQNATANLITAYRYRFNNDAVTTVTLGKPESPYTLDALIALPDDLDPEATHNFCIQFCDTHGYWSIERCATFRFDNVTPVTGLTIDIALTIVAGEPVTLSATVEPPDATSATVIWTVIDAGTTGATITGNALTTTGAGTVVIRATIPNGKGDGEDFTKDFTITVNPAFVAVANVAGVPTTATAGTPLTLTGTVVPSDATNKTIVWSVQSAGTTGATITGGNTLNTTAAGTVTVRATIASGATATADYTQDFNITVTAKQVTGTEINDAPLATLYPNPTSSMFTLEFEVNGVYNITLTDMSGKVLLRETVAGQTARINVSNYPAGTYLLTIDDGKRLSTTKVVKN